MWSTINFLIHDAIKSSATSINVEVNSIENTIKFNDNGNGLDEEVVNRLKNQKYLNDIENLDGSSNSSSKSMKLSSLDSFFCSSNFLIALSSCDKFTIETSSVCQKITLVYKNQQLLEDENDSDLEADKELKFGTSVLMELSEKIENIERLLNRIRNKMEFFALTYHSSISFALLLDGNNNNTKELVYRANRKCALGDQVSLINRISLNNIYCVSSGEDNLYAELCFFCDVESNLKNIFYRNNHHEKDSSIIEFVLFKISKCMPGIKFIGNLECSHNFKDQRIQWHLDKCINVFVEHFLCQSSKSKNMNNRVDFAMEDNGDIIDLTEDESNLDSNFLTITYLNEDEFYDFVCSELDLEYSSQDIELCRRPQHLYDIDEWFSTFTFPNDVHNLEYEQEELTHEIDALRNLTALGRLEHKVQSVKKNPNTPVVVIDLNEPSSKDRQYYFSKKSTSRGNHALTSPSSNKFAKTASNKKVYDKIRKIDKSFYSDEIRRNVDVINKNAFQKTKQDQKNIKLSLMFQDILAQAKDNICQSKDPEQGPTKKKLYPIQSFDLKSFKIPKINSATSFPTKIHSVGSPTSISDAAATAKKMHLNDLYQETKKKREAESLDCSIVSWIDNNRNNDAISRKSIKLDSDSEDLELIKTYQKSPTKFKSSPGEPQRSPKIKYNIFRSKNHQRNKEDDRLSNFPNVPKRHKTDGLKDFNII